MPWKPEDAHKHKKGLSKEQAKKWAEIANSVLDNCLKKSKKSRKECEGKAVRVANSKVGSQNDNSAEAGGLSMNKKQYQIPKGGLRLTESSPEINFAASPAASGEAERTYITLEAYSGRPMKVWPFDDIIVDVSGIDFRSKRRWPILEQHNLDWKIGVSNGKPATGEGKVKFDEVKVLSNEKAQEFEKNLADGFPYECSISVEPLVTEEVAEGEKVEVNGKTYKGPLTVLRRSNFREASVCVFGADPNTKVAQASEDGLESIEVEVLSASGGNSTEPVAASETEDDKNRDNTGGRGMDLEQIKETHPELYKEINRQFSEYAKQVEDLTKERDQLKTERDQVKASQEQTEQRIVNLEKQMEGYKLRDVKAQAQSIADSYVKASSIPEYLQGKVKSQFDHTRFLDANGQFDEAKFSEHVSGEVADWETHLKASADPVAGLSGSGGSNYGAPSVDAAEEKESDDLANTMVSMAPGTGQSQ